MKHSILIAILGILGLALVSGPALGQALSPHITVVLIDQIPFPAEPGKTVELEVEIQNDGKGSASNTVVEIMPSPPFTLLPGQEKIKSFDLIPAGSSVKNSYTLQVDGDAITNEYKIEFKITTESTSFIREITVKVQGEPEIILENVLIEPDSPEAGGETELTVYVKNVGTGNARHLTLRMNGTAELIPILSKGTTYLGDLPPDNTVVALIGLSIDKSAEEKTYISLLEASYLDESNSDNKKTFNIGIPVSGKVRLDILKIEPNYERELLEIEVANKGTTDAKSVEATLYSNGELVDIDYISQIKPTKKTTFSFPLVREGEGSLVLNYIGPGLEESNITKELVFNFSGNQDSSSLYTPIVIIVIIIIAAFYFRRRRKKSRK